MKVYIVTVEHWTNPLDVEFSVDSVHEDEATANDRKSDLETSNHSGGLHDEPEWGWKTVKIVEKVITEKVEKPF